MSNRDDLNRIVRDAVDHTEWKAPQRQTPDARQVHDRDANLRVPPQQSESRVDRREQFSTQPGTLTLVPANRL